MSDDLWARDEISSPCIKVCVVHPQARICTGCLRTLDEIASWASFTPERRASVMADLPARKPLLETRRGGRAARLRDRDGTQG